MRRLLLVLALVAGVSACSDGDDAAVTVNGHEVLDTAELQDQLAALGDDEDFLTTFDGRGAGQDTLKAGFVASVLSNHVLDALLVEELDDRGLEVDEENQAQGEQELSQAVGGPVETIPPGYRELLVDLFAHAAALREDVGGNEPLQELVTGLLEEADVDIADRYGDWDPEQHQVVAPSGPVELEG